MIKDRGVLVIFQNSFRRVALSERAEVVISGNSPVLIRRSRGHLLLAGVISIRWCRVFAAKNFQSLFLPRPTERWLRINALCNLRGLRPVFLLVSTQPLITPCLR